MSKQTKLLLLFWLFYKANGWLTTWSTRQVFPRTRLHSKFSQPAFSQPAFTGNASSSRPTNKRVKPIPRKKSGGGDSRIASLHSQRMKTAGRFGTKRYVDPCKVFFGNVPFNATEKMLEEWVVEHMGLPAPVLLSQVKVIRDWKTGDSKGYAFVSFREPIQATVCIEKCQGKMLGGRMLSLAQGKKKETTQVFVKKKEAPPVDAEEAAIQSGMEEASHMLRQLDPDLVDDGSFDNDEELFGDLGGDDEEIDGIYFEGDDDEDQVEEASMNRQRRRELARRNKKRKPSSKGFGDL